MTMLSINHATTETSSVTDLALACARAGIGGVAPWRHRYLNGDVAATRSVLDDNGIRATSLCRGGFFTGTRSETAAHEDNRRAVEEAAVLGAPVLVLVCGPVDRATGMLAAEAAIARGIERLLPYAIDHGVALAVEPFHPMLAAERSALVTVAQATRLVRDVLGSPSGSSAAGSPLGLAIDTYHVWWDPDLDASLQAAADLVLGVHVADWLVPTPDLLAGRGLPGDGVIPLHRLLRQLHSLGFDGPLEVEVLNAAVWARDPGELVAEIRDRMAPITDWESVP